MLRVSGPHVRVMTEYAAPYAVEGFTGRPMPTDIMQSMFNQMLQITPAQNITVKKTGFGSTKGDIDSKCPPQPSPPVLSGAGSPKTATSSAFLKTLITQQLDAANSLMATAKAINPVEKSVGQMDAAYDAAFESDVKAPTPYPGETLQGFTVLLFVFSYISLAIISTIMVSILTRNPKLTAATFALFVVMGAIMIGIFRQLG